MAAVRGLPKSDWEVDWVWDRVFAILDSCLSDLESVYSDRKEKYLDDLDFDPKFVAQRLREVLAKLEGTQP